MKKKYSCPHCGEKFSQKEKFFPFCSDRCKQIDLGNWALERYKVPVTESKDELETLEDLDEALKHH